MRNPSNVLQRIATAPFRLILGIGEFFSRWFLSVTGDIRNFFSEEPEDSPITEAFAKTIEHPQGLLVHLDALRKHLLRAVAFLMLTTAFSFLFAHRILEFLTRPLPGGVDSIVAIEVTEPIGTLMRVSLLSGFALALPYIALEMWLFIAPGVSRKARIWGLLAIPVSVIFFLGGMAFAYFVMLPTAIPFLLNILGITTQVRPSSYIGFVTGLMFWVGIAFEFPLVIFLLAGVGLIKAKTLASQWRLAIVIIAVISALITPTVDPVNMALVMGPMIGLFFLSIGLAFLAQRGRS
jgi:sec-independent protein translocase protein TatC